MNKILKIAATFGCLLIAGSHLSAFCPDYPFYPPQEEDDIHGFFKPDQSTRMGFKLGEANGAKFASTFKTDLADSEVVIGLEHEGTTWCFPLRLMAVHRIATVPVRGEMMSVTYCPLSDSAVVYRPYFMASSGKRKGNTTLRYEGVYAGSMVFGVYLRANAEYASKYSLHSQLNPSMQNMANKDGRSLKLGPPVVITTYGAWRTRHPITAVMQPFSPDFEARYSEYDAHTRGFTPSDLRDATIRIKDARLSPGANVFGVAIEQDAVAFTLDEIERLGSVTTLVGVQSVTINWDKQLGTPIVVDPPQGIVATRANWYSWSSHYPNVPLNETGSRAAVTEWAIY